MYSLDIIIIAVCASSLVSGLAVIALRTWVKSAIEHRFRSEVEKLKMSHQTAVETLKAQLSVVSAVYAKMAERRLDSYPKIVELIYRIRNICRQVSDLPPPWTETMESDLATRVEELTEILYSNRLDLELDGIFRQVHVYKRLAQTFSRQFSNTRALFEAQETERARQAQQEMIDCYLLIESECTSVIAVLSVEASGA